MSNDDSYADDMFGDAVYEAGVEDTDESDADETFSGKDWDEPLETSYSPPEREPWDLRHRLNDGEEGESLDERLADEEPDITAEHVTDADPDPRAGRLVAPDEGAHADREEDEVATDVGAAGYASSAEEAAVHVVDEDELDPGIEG